MDGQWMWSLNNLRIPCENARTRGLGMCTCMRLVLVGSALTNERMRWGGVGGDEG